VKHHNKKHCNKFDDVITDHTFFFISLRRIPSVFAVASILQFISHVAARIAVNNMSAHAKSKNNGMGIIVKRMLENSSVSVVMLLPCHNVEAAIVNVVRNFRTAMPGTEVDVMAKNDRKAFIVESNSFAMLRRR